MEYWTEACRLDKLAGTHEHELYFLALFETGGRISEVLELRPEQFFWNDEAIVVDRMLVLKLRKKVGTRNMIIKLDWQTDPLSYRLLDYVKACGSKYLLPCARLNSI